MASKDVTDMAFRYEWVLFSRVLVARGLDQLVVTAVNWNDIKPFCV